jgi:hypothetical protein
VRGARKLVHVLPPVYILAAPCKEKPFVSGSVALDKLDKVRKSAGPLRCYITRIRSVTQETSKAINVNIEMQMANNVVRSGTKLAMLNTVKKDTAKGSKAGMLKSF